MERGVGEGRWLKDALKRACEGYSIDLSQYLANPKGNPYRRFMAEQYDARRCALFHAKLDKQPIVPGDIPSRTELAEATRRLGQLYVRLASAITGADCAGGSMTFAAFERMMAPMADSRMYISESLDFNPDNLRVAPGSLTLRDRGLPGLHTLTGQWRRGAGLSNGTICRAGSLLQKDDAIDEAIYMQCEIVTEGVDVLEIALQTEFANAQNLREWFL